MDDSKTALLEAIEAASGQANLAMSIGGLQQPIVSAWLHGQRPIPPERCVMIEQLYGVKCDRLRPDLRWVRVPSAGWPEGKPVLDVLADESPAA